MSHLAFLYYTLCYSIGFPALAVIALAWRRTGDRTLRDYLPFLAGVTLQLIAVAALRYQDAVSLADRPELAALSRRLYFVVESSMVFTLPLFCHRLAGSARPRLRAILFGGLWLGCVALIVSPLSLRYDPSVGQLVSGWGFLVYRGILFAVIAYSLALVAARFGRLTARGLRLIAALCACSVAFALWEMLHCPLLPVRVHVPAGIPLSPAGYFVTNLLFLGYAIREHLRPASPPPPQDPELVPDRVMESHGVSAREREIAALLLEGANLRQIGRELFISESTVKTHVKSIYRKLAIGNRVQLVNALRKGRARQIPPNG